MQRRYGASALLYCLGLYCGRLFPQVAPVATVLVRHCGILVSCRVAYGDFGACSQHLHRQEVDLFCCGSDIVVLFHNLYRPPLTPPLWGELLHRGGVRRVFYVYTFFVYIPRRPPHRGGDAHRVEGLYLITTLRPFTIYIPFVGFSTRRPMRSYTSVEG